MVSPLSGLSLKGAPDQTLNSILGGRQSYEQSQLNQQALQQGEQQISRADYDQAVQRLGVINRLAEKARSLATPQERDGFINSINPEMLKSVGIDPASIANAPRDDQGLDALIAQTGAAMPQDFKQARVQSSVQYKNGTIQQTLANGTIRVIDPSGQEVSGADAKRVIDEANQYEIQTSTQKAGSVADIKNQSDLGYAGQIKRNEKLAEADVELATRPEIQRQTDAAKLAEERKNKAFESGDKYNALISGFEEARAIIPLSTGSSLGSMKNAAGKVIGFTSEAAQNTKRLKSLQAWLVTQVPKPGGAVSDADLVQFKDAVGNIAEDIPPEERMAAIETAEKIIKRYQNTLGGSGQGGATPSINGNVGRFKIEVQD